MIGIKYQKKCFLGTEPVEFWRDGHWPCSCDVTVASGAIVKVISKAVEFP